MSPVPRIVLSTSSSRADLSACPSRSVAELVVRGLLPPPDPRVQNPELSLGIKIDTGFRVPAGNDQGGNTGEGSDDGDCPQAGKVSTAIAGSESKYSGADYREVNWSVQVARVVRVRRLSRRIVFLDVDLNVSLNSDLKPDSMRKPISESLAPCSDDVSVTSPAIANGSSILEVALKHPICPDVRAHARHAHIGRLVSLRGPLVDLQPAKRTDPTRFKRPYNEDGQPAAAPVADYPASAIAHAAADPVTADGGGARRYRGPALPLFLASSLLPVPAASAAVDYTAVPDAAATAGVAPAMGEAQVLAGGETGAESAAGGPRWAGEGFAGEGKGGQGERGSVDVSGWRMVVPEWGVWENLPGGGENRGGREAEAEEEHGGGEGEAEESIEEEGESVDVTSGGGSIMAGVTAHSTVANQPLSHVTVQNSVTPQNLQTPQGLASSLPSTTTPSPLISSSPPSASSSPPRTQSLHDLSALPPLPPSAPPLSSLCKFHLNTGRCSASPLCPRAHPPAALLPVLRLHWIAHRQHRRRHCCSQGEGDPHRAEGKRGKQVRAELFAAWLVGKFGRGRLLGEAGVGGEGGVKVREWGDGVGIGGKEGKQLEREKGGVDDEEEEEEEEEENGGNERGEEGKEGGAEERTCRGVLDIAGGRGGLAFALERGHGVRATVVDPRGVRLSKKQVRDLMGLQQPQQQPHQQQQGSKVKEFERVGGVEMGTEGFQESDGVARAGAAAGATAAVAAGAAGAAAAGAEAAGAAGAAWVTAGAAAGEGEGEGDPPTGAQSTAAQAAAAQTAADPTAQLASLMPSSPQSVPSVPLPPHQSNPPIRSKKALRRAYLTGALWKPQSIQKEFSAADSCWAAMGFSCFVGLHPDEVTGDIVFAAARARIPFAVVPCCVFPGRFSGRRVAVGGQMKKVETYEDLVEYLTALCRYFGGCPKVDWLNFSGKNLVLYCLEYQ